MKRNTLDRITDHIILSGSFLDSVGLLHGKMGLSIFLAHYSTYVKSDLLRTLAINMVEEVYEDIHEKTPLTFEDGLCGIGWGIEYLVHHNYIDADTSEILEDINYKVMEVSPRRFGDLSFKTGLSGVNFYVKTHATSKHSKQSIFQPDFIFELDSMFDLCSNKTEAYIEPTLKISQVYSNTLSLDDENLVLNKYPLGLENGLAGYALKKILL